MRAFLFRAIVLPLKGTSEIQRAANSEIHKRKGKTMTLTEELITAAVAATDEKKAAALRILRGEGRLADDETQRTLAGQAEPYLTLRECGRRLGLSACSLWRWGVPGHELGGRRKFRMTEVEAYLQSKEFRRKAAGLRKAKALSCRLREDATPCQGRQVAVASGQDGKTVAA